MSARTALVALAFAGVACSSTVATDPAPAPSETVPEAAAPTRPTVEAELARFLTGSFDSKDQAASDKSYFEISLEICPIDAKEIGERVLYVEQARVGSAPYRQRLYVIDRKDETTAVSRVFELKAPKSWVGACAREERKASPADADEKIGCSVEMHRVGDAFEGATPDLTWTGSTFEKSKGNVRCPSELNGATYASSTVRLEENLMVSWDRGYDDAGKQVWGATAGGYRFVRRR